MILQQVNTSQLSTGAGFSISDYADIANIVIATLAFIFSIYSFWIQRERDRQSRKEEEILRAKTIRLQWYKDLVITPNIQHLQGFYKTLEELNGKITTSDLNDNQKRDLIEEVKRVFYHTRITLIDSILPISIRLHEELLVNLEDLVDEITNAIDNDTLKLSHSTVYADKIGQPIHKSKQSDLNLIYGYRGD